MPLAAATVPFAPSCPWGGGRFTSSERCPGGWIRRVSPAGRCCPSSHAAFRQDPEHGQRCGLAPHSGATPDAPPEVLADVSSQVCLNHDVPPGSTVTAVSSNRRARPCPSWRRWPAACPIRSSRGSMCAVRARPSRIQEVAAHSIAAEVRASEPSPRQTPGAAPSVAGASSTSAARRRWRAAMLAHRAMPCCALSAGISAAAWHCQALCYISFESSDLIAEMT